MANFPAVLDDFTPKTDNVNDVMAVDVNELQTAIESLEAKIGIDASLVTGSLDYKVANRLDLDQTTPQTIANGIPLLPVAISAFDTSSQIVNKEYVDSVLGFKETYFFNNTASSIGGIYYKMLDTPTGEAEVTFASGSLGVGTAQALVNFATDANIPGTTMIKSGIYMAHIHAHKASAVGKTSKIYYQIFNRTSGGVETLIATSEKSDFLTTTKEGYELHATVIADVSVLVTDRRVIKWFTDIAGSGTDAIITLYVEGTNSSNLTIPTTTEILSSVFVRQDGTKPLTADWNVGAHSITAANLSGNNTGDQSASSLGLGNVDNTADVNKAVLSATKWVTARNLAGNSVDGSGDVAFANKFIVQGTADAGLSGAQFLGALSTGLLKVTTTTGALSVAGAGDIPDLSATYVTKALYDANTILYATTDNTPAALTIAASTIVGRKASGNIVALTAAEVLVIIGVAAGAEVNVNADWNAVSGDAQILNKPTLGTMAAETATNYVTKALYDASSILYADTDNTPAALTIGANTVVGRIAAGIVAIAIDSDLASVSANDDTIPSAKATKAYADLKLPLAGGTMTGDLALGTATSATVGIALNSSALADEKWSGVTINGLAKGALAIGDIIVPTDTSNTRWEIADANVITAAPGDARGMIGICLTTASNAGDSIKILLSGMIASASFPNFTTLNAPLYLSETAGDITLTQPTTADVCIRVLGFSITATVMYFNPSPDYITHT